MFRLSPERWHQLEALFSAVAALPESDRASAIERETGSDLELRSLLERMLKASVEAPDRIAAAIGQTANAVLTSDWSGRRFGPYEVVREIGRGGMGVVFEAVRADDEYRKRVALKIAPDWRGGPGLVERFRAERQILAELEHENIARFLDGGTENGIPYFVMELVDGEPLTTFCERHALDLKGRLALFRKACDAVSFAHERFVVHRDLKPANILVTGQGVPKLVDFGIAKLLDPVNDTGATLTASPAWTPDYVSPEQVRGRPITARTDVYSLGLVLYELVCGDRGQKADTTSLLALDRSVCETEPVRPSVRLVERGDRTRARQAMGDLDTIVLKAISKDPGDRYGSVAALSDDLERFLEDRLILARPSGRLHRASKFIRRHRAGVAAGLVMLAIAVVGFASTFVAARRAEHRFQQVRSLANSFVFDVHDRIAPLPGSTEARHAIVTTALAYLESLRDGTDDDPALARELAAAYEKIGSVQGLPVESNLGDTAGALQSYQRGIAILQPLADRGDHEARRQLASTLGKAAVVQRARGNPREAFEEFNRAHDVAQQLLDGAPNDERVLGLVGNIDADKSRAAFELRDFSTAERDGTAAMEIGRKLVALAPSNRGYLDNLATAHNALAAVQIGAGKLAEAATHYREAVKIRERLVAEDPDSTEHRRNLAVAYGGLGDVLGTRTGENLGDTAGALEAFGKAAELAERARRQDPNDRRALYDLANIRVRLGTLHSEAEPPRYSDALRELQAADAHTRALLTRDGGVATYQYLSLVIARRLGDVLDGLGRPRDAVASLERAREIGGRLRSGPNAPNVRTVLTQATARLALLRARAGEADAATKHADDVSAELKKGPLGITIVDAAAHALVAQANLEIARRLAGSARSARIQLAQAHVEESLRLWRQAVVAPPLEPKRAKAVAALERDRERLRP